MRTLFLILIVAGSGCHSAPKNQPPFKGSPTFSQYHSETFRWGGVSRVLVLPLLNESNYTRADEEVGTALRAELQSLGRFEAVAAAPDSVARLAATIHRTGRFNEATMLELGAEARADIILHGTITQYSAYPRPRLGLVLQAVSPPEGKAIASVDGVWDSTRFDVSNRILEYYRMRPHTHPWVVNHTPFEDDSYSGELALASPQLFQRFVCAEAVLNLVKDGGDITAAMSGQSNCDPNASKYTPQKIMKNFPPGW